MMNSNQVKKGLIFALITAFLSGFSIFYNKLLVTSGIDPLIFNIIKNGSVALLLTLILLKSGTLPSGPKIPWLKLLLLGIVGGSIPFILYFEGLENVAAANANLIHKTLFIFVAILAIPYLKEKLMPVQILGYLLVIYANFFIGGLAGFKFSISEGMILIATILWSAENIIAKKILKTADSSLATWGRMFFGSIILLLVGIFSGKTGLFFKLTANQLIPIIGSIIFLTFYVLSFYKALKFAPATSVTAILVLATPITNILSAAFISHNFQPLLTFNTTAILLGVLLISTGFRWRTKIAV